MNKPTTLAVDRSARSGMSLGSIACTAAILVLLQANSSKAQEATSEQSTTGPKPPANVIPKSNMQLAIEAAAYTIPGVPGYAWRHGCGPTAVGMVVGYYDRQGYSALIPADASTQTYDVNQAIASQGSGTRGSGTQKHYEDYALPMDDSTPAMISDSSATYPSGCHINDSIADFMQTSWSSMANRYGWSWSSRIIPSFTSYVNLRNSSYAPKSTMYLMGSSLNWTVIANEINAQRPMVFLVDSDGDGATDHFVTIVGYNDTPTQQYGCLDTWDPPSQIRWCQFRGMSSSYAWGVSRGWSFSLSPVKPIVPSPGNGNLDQSLSVDLNWSDGGGAASYDVYFGKNPAPGLAEFKKNQTESSFDPGLLAVNTLYYWRIDVRGVGGSLATGNVWSFRTVLQDADSDGDGVSDSSDLCSHTISGVNVDLAGCPPYVAGDFDRDGDVDAGDLILFRNCASGPSIMYPAGCSGMDLDSDADVDQVDFAVWQVCFSGENIPGDPGCASPFNMSIAGDGF